jgi:hypothetical protein
MQNKTPADFGTHDDWLSYVCEEIPATEQPYALALGRTNLFKRFYEVRKLIFPVEFGQELGRIGALSDPVRTSELESLNGRIFSKLTETLFDEAQPRMTKSEAHAAGTPQEQVRKLRDHLEKNNPYFALWSVYKTNYSEMPDSGSWHEYLCRELGTENGDEVAFASAMAELDKQLGYFEDKNQALPRYSFERIWFLHSLRERERMPQTRAVLNTLTVEIEACASA